MKVNIFTKYIYIYSSLQIIQEEFTELLTTDQLHRFYSLRLHWRPMEIRTAPKITSRGLRPSSSEPRACALCTSSGFF